MSKVYCEEDVATIDVLDKFEADADFKSEDFEFTLSAYGKNKVQAYNKLHTQLLKLQKEVEKVKHDCFLKWKKEAIRRNKND